MPVTNLDFAAQIKDWTNRTEEKMEGVFKKTAELLFEGVRNNTPVDTGNLKASFIEMINAVPQIDPGLDGKKKRAVARPSAIPNAKLGDTITGGFSANYAGYVEFGTSRQPARGMVRLAVQRFPEFVEAAIRQADNASRGI